MKKFRIIKKRIIKDLYVRKLSEDIHFRKLINEFKQEQFAYEHLQDMGSASRWKF